MPPCGYTRSRGPPSSLLWARLEQKPTKNGATGPAVLDIQGGPEAAVIQQRPLEVMQGQTDRDNFQQVKGERAKAAALLAQSKQQVAQPGQTEHTPCYTPPRTRVPLTLEGSESTTPLPTGLFSSPLPAKHLWVEHKHKLRQGCCCQGHPHLPTRKSRPMELARATGDSSKVAPRPLAPQRGPGVLGHHSAKKHVSLEMRRKEQPPFLSIRASTRGGTAGHPFRQTRTHPRAS